MQGYQLKITIRDSHPPIWRRVIVPEHINFYDLDNIIEALFGWTHSHLFGFHFPLEDMEFTGSPYPEEEDNAQECVDEWLKEGCIFRYIYDFGDNWEHVIKVEKVVDYDKRYPTVLKSKGPNMIEDCGGLWGFYEFIEQAETFDMDGVNREFESWDIKESISEKRNYDDLWDMDFSGELSGISEKEDIARNVSYKVECLVEVFSMYSKEDLKTLAKVHGFTGYSKYNKGELAEWLKNQLLDEQYMKELLLGADEDDVELFQNIMDSEGGMVNEEMIEYSILLSSYGAYNPYLDFCQIPGDVQKVYRKINTEEFRNCLQDCWSKRNYCRGAVYLYGAVSIQELQEIYHYYEKREWLEEDAKSTIDRLTQWEEGFVFKAGLLMHSDLAEQQFYRFLRQNQSKYERYFPKDREDFLEYGKYECQNVDEDTGFFIEYLQKSHNMQVPQAMMTFYGIQEAVRMNASEEKQIELLEQMGRKLSAVKQVKTAVENIRKLARYTRTWDLNGHNENEIHPFLPYSSGRKIYPNELCPCGSGKKYKHCCGRK